MGKESCELYNKGCSQGRACIGRGRECAYFLATKERGVVCENL